MEVSSSRTVVWDRELASFVLEIFLTASLLLFSIYTSFTVPIISLSMYWLGYVLSSFLVWYIELYYFIGHSEDCSRWSLHYGSKLRITLKKKKGQQQLQLTFGWEFTYLTFLNLFYFILAFQALIFLLHIITNRFQPITIAFEFKFQHPRSLSQF